MFDSPYYRLPLRTFLSCEFLEVKRFWSFSIEIFLTAAAHE